MPAPPAARVPGTEGTTAARRIRSLNLCVLGTTKVSDNGAGVQLRPRERDVLAALALNHPQPTAIDVVISTLWPDGPPRTARTARTAVQNHVSRIRRSLGNATN